MSEVYLLLQTNKVVLMLEKILLMSLFSQHRLGVYFSIKSALADPEVSVRMLLCEADKSWRPSDVLSCNYELLGSV